MPISPDQYHQTARLLDQAGSILLTSHVRPDGDALGSLVAMRQVLRALGKHVLPVLLDPPPPRYHMLLEPEPLPRWPDQISPQQAARVDAILILDTCAYSQLEPIADFLRTSRAVKIALDHHLTRDDLADCYLVDPEAPAACTLLWHWCQHCNWPLDPLAALALFVGMSTDSGWFRFANTTTTLLSAAADLVARGVRPDLLYDQLYQSEPPQRIRLLGAMLDTLQLHANGRLALVHLTQPIFRRCGATPYDTEDLINEPARIASVIVTALFVEEDDGRVRLSLRSKHTIDVAAIARRFGGGGHASAAGARANLPLDEFQKQITALVFDALRAAP